MTRTLQGALVALLFVLSGCGAAPGDPCAIEGDGFQASDNCRYRCLQHRPITCPDRREINPQVCSGKPGCTPGSCGAGELCYTVFDPTNLESYCIPADLCGPLDEAQQQNLEAGSLQEARALRARHAAQQLKKKDATKR